MRWLAPAMPGLSHYFHIGWDDPPDMPPYLLEVYLDALREINQANKK